MKKIEIGNDPTALNKRIGKMLAFLAGAVYSGEPSTWPGKERVYTVKAFPDPFSYMIKISPNGKVEIWDTSEDAGIPFPQG